MLLCDIKCTVYYNNSSLFGHSVDPRMHEEPREQLLGVHAETSAVHHHVKMVILGHVGRVAIDQDITSRTAAKLVAKHVHSKRIQADIHADQQNEAHLVALPLVVELASHRLQLTSHAIHEPNHVGHITLGHMEPGANITQLGEEGTRDTLHVGHSNVKVDMKTSRLKYISRDIIRLLDLILM